MSDVFKEPIKGCIETEKCLTNRLSFVVNTTSIQSLNVMTLYSALCPLTFIRVTPLITTWIWPLASHIFIFTLCPLTPDPSPWPLKMVTHSIFINFQCKTRWVLLGTWLISTHFQHIILILAHFYSFYLWVLLITLLISILYNQSLSRPSQRIPFAHAQNL